MIYFIQAFHIFAFIFFQLCASSPAEILDMTKTILRMFPDSPERDQLIAIDTLRSSIESGAQHNVSIFKHNLDFLAKTFKRTKREQYIRMMDALCEHLIKFCLDYYKAHMQNQHLPCDTGKLARLMVQVAQEFHYFASYDAPEYEIPDNTVTMIFKLLQRVNPARPETFLTIMGLSSFCKSKACIKPAFEMVKYFILNIHRENEFETGMSINKNLQALPEFDNFLRELITEPLNRYAAPISAVQTLLTGPITDYSNELLMSLLTEDVINLISRENWTIRKLVYRINQSNLYDQVINLIRPTNNMTEILKSRLISYNKKYKTIRQILQIDFRYLNPYDNIDISPDCLNEYYGIDKELVTECAVKMNQGIFELAERSRRENSTDLLKCALSVMTIMPSRRIPELFYSNYEVLLDLILEPANLDALTSASISSLGVKNIVRSYHSEISPSILQKFWRINVHFFGESLASNSISFTLSIILNQLLLGPKLEAPSRFFQVLKIIHNFTDNVELNSMIFSTDVLFMAIEAFSSTISEEILNYYINHKLIGRTETLVAQKLLRKYD